MSGQTLKVENNEEYIDESATGWHYDNDTKMG